MMKKYFITIIEVYQRLLSPFLRPRCVFFPTCSEYSKKSIQKHGAVRGLHFAINRVLSCHPFTKKNYWDPVK